MATDFIPELWSNLIYTKLYKDLVALAITNQNYDGEIRSLGDKLHIYSPGTITSKPYTPNTTIDPAEVPQGTEAILEIDQSDYFNFQLDKVIQLQAKPALMVEHTKEAAYSLRKSIDSYVLGHYTYAGIQDTIIDPDRDSVYSFFNHMWKLFDENDVPETDRAAVVTPRIMESIREYWAARKTAFADQAIANGFMGKFAEWNLYKSNNVPTTTTYTSDDTDQCIFTHRSAITFGFQIPPTSFETYRPHDTFADAVKGLDLYGAKTLDPNRLGNGVFVFT